MSSNITKKNRAANFIWTVTAFVLAALLIWSWTGERSSGSSGVFPQSHMEIAHADGSKASFAIEVATTPEQQERGLMFRKSLAPDAGMLFLWKEDQPVSMWMKNTFIPLDMLFVAHDGRITKIAERAVPFDLTPISSNGLVRAVIEIGGGEALRQDIAVGDKVIYSGLSSFGETGSGATLLNQ